MRDCRHARRLSRRNLMPAHVRRTDPFETRIPRLHEDRRVDLGLRSPSTAATRKASRKIVCIRFLNRSVRTSSDGTPSAPTSTPSTPSFPGFAKSNAKLRAESPLLPSCGFSAFRQAAVSGTLPTLPIRRFTVQGFLDNPHSLPDTMSGLLATAIDDARQLDRTLYHPRCGEWHTAWEHRPCQVCLAGSVIAGSLGASHHQTLYPNIFRAPFSTSSSPSTSCDAASGFSPSKLSTNSIRRFLHQDNSTDFPVPTTRTSTAGRSSTVTSTLWRRFFPISDRSNRTNASPDRCFPVLPRVLRFPPVSSERKAPHPSSRRRTS